MSKNGSSPSNGTNVPASKQSDSNPGDSNPCDSNPNNVPPAPSNNQSTLKEESDKGEHGTPTPPTVSTNVVVEDVSMDGSSDLSSDMNPKSPPSKKAKVTFVPTTTTKDLRKDGPRMTASLSAPNTT